MISKATPTLVINAKAPGSFKNSPQTGQLEPLSSYFSHRPKTRIAIVTSRFNEHISNPLQVGAIELLLASGILPENIELAWVPGAIELPLMAKRYLDTKVDAVICLGCVIRGDTNHYDYVCSMAANGIQHLSLEYGKPVMFGLLTCNTEEQALARVYEVNDPDHQHLNPIGNKGKDSAHAALEMLFNLQSI